jgi:hypothetical protein
VEADAENCRAASKATKPNHLADLVITVIKENGSIVKKL